MPVPGLDPGIVAGIHVFSCGASEAHVIPAVARVYDRHDYLSEKLDALEKLDPLVDRILKTIDW
jgi:hypothetical protein